MAGDFGGGKLYLIGLNGAQKRALRPRLLYFKIEGCLFATRLMKNILLCFVSMSRPK